MNMASILYYQGVARHISIYNLDRIYNQIFMNYYMQLESRKSTTKNTHNIYYV